MPGTSIEVMMPHWLRVVRGMVGTGLTFGAGVGVLTSIAGMIGLALGKLSMADLPELIGKPSVVAFIVGVAFAGVLALTARGRSLDRLSLRLVAGLGAGVGFVYFLFIAMVGGIGAWSVSDAIANLLILIAIGGGSAAAILLVARRAGRSLHAGDDAQLLGEGAMDGVAIEREAELRSRR